MDNSTIYLRRSISPSKVLLLKFVRKTETLNTTPLLSVGGERVWCEPTHEDPRGRHKLPGSLLGDPQTSDLEGGFGRPVVSLGSLTPSSLTSLISVIGRLRHPSGSDRVRPLTR